MTLHAVVVVAGVAVSLLLLAVLAALGPTRRRRAVLSMKVIPERPDAWIRVLDRPRASRFIFRRPRTVGRFPPLCPAKPPGPS